jgi:hypothetical protein
MPPAKPVQLQSLVRVLYDDGKVATVMIPWMEIGLNPAVLLEEQLTLIKEHIETNGYAEIHKSATETTEQQRMEVENRAKRATEYNRGKGDADEPTAQKETG